jgi:uncharacterized protein (DUF302 family)
MSEPWRFWVTGAAAVVWAALTQMPSDGDLWTSRSSRHSVAETARRIEREARERGLPVFAKWSTREAGSLVLVLGTGEGETPVLQPAPDAALELPLTVWLSADGRQPGARIRFSDGRRLREQADLPRELERPVAALPQLIDAALRG